MNNKIKNVKVWIEEHKKEIGIGALAVITTVGGVVLFKKFGIPANAMGDAKSTCTNKTNVWPKQLYISDIGVGFVDDAQFYQPGHIELWMDDIPLTEMGELGESIIDHFYNEGITKESEVWALLSVRPKRIEVN